MSASAPLEVATHSFVSKIGLPSPVGVLSKKWMHQPVTKERPGLIHPLPHYRMWRGNHNKYWYNQYQSANWGEGGTKDKYHQYFAHAKDPKDYGRAGREFEFIIVRRGKLVKKPLPKVQYVNPDSKPTWNMKSWHAELGTSQVWQREVEYPEHIPEHIGAKRPLSPLAPVTWHRRLSMAHMERIDIVVCPLIFGFGNTQQKAVLDFYRHCISARTRFPAEKVFLFYTIDQVTPKIEVTWVDGSKYTVPIFEFGHPLEYVQMVMEQSWLQADKMLAAGKTLQPLTVDDYKWQELIVFKKKKAAEAEAAAAPGKK